VGDTKPYEFGFFVCAHLHIVEYLQLLFPEKGGYDVKLLRKTPLALVLVLAWISARTAGVDFSIVTPWAWMVAIASMVVSMLEFYKSGDIMIHSFKIDITCSVIATVIMSSGATYVWMSQNVYFVDMFVVAVVLFDALVSPINSFRSALRNMQAGVNSAPVDSAE